MLSHCFKQISNSCSQIRSRYRINFGTRCLCQLRYRRYCERTTFENLDDVRAIGLYILYDKLILDELETFSTICERTLEIKETMKDFQGNVDTASTEEIVITDNNYMTKADDKYGDAIDLSNACREFYQARKRAAEVVKEKLANPGRQRTPKKKTSIDTAMETLRTEMASLMDQDLSLMKQLLTLNEAIEDLKWQKKYNQSDMSIQDSTCDLSDSDWSVSETDMYDSENEVPRKYPTPSSLSLHSPLRNTEDSGERKSDHSLGTCVKCSYEKVDNFCRDNVSTSQPIATSTGRSLSKDFELFLSENTTTCHEEQNSFDSGIHEAVLPRELTA